MAKQPKQSTAPAKTATTPTTTSTTTPVTAPKEPKATKTATTKIGTPRGNDNDVYTRVMVNNAKGKLVGATGKLGDKEYKGAPQVQVILNLLEASPKNQLTRKELMEKLIPAGLKTRQPVQRIVGYYQSDMVKAGTITVKEVGGTPAAAPAPTPTPVAPTPAESVTDEDEDEAEA
jgi:hypothetical protein